MSNNPGEEAGKSLKSRWRNPLLILSYSTFFIASFSFAIYLIELAYEGFFARFLADDFCYVNSAIQQGLFRGFLNFYNVWSGRYSTIFLTQLGSVSWYLFPSILPLILIIALFVSLFYFYQQLFQIFHISENKRYPILTSFASLFFFLLMAPNRYEILDWVNGSVTYSGPLIVMVLLITWLIRIIRVPDLKKPWLTGVGIALLAFIGSGFSEANTALLITSLSILCLLSLLFIKKGQKWQTLRWQLVALAGAILGLGTMLLAPGNEVRKGVLNLVSPNISEMVTTSLRFSWDFIIDTLKTKPVPTLILIGFCILIGYIANQKDSNHNTYQIKKLDILPFFLIPIISFALYLSVIAPSVYFQSAYPAERTLSGAMFIFIISISLFGLFLGNLFKILSGKLRPHWQNTLTVCSMVLLLLVSVYPIRAAILNIPEIQETIQFGQAWDLRHSMIKSAVAQNQFNLVVPDINGPHGMQDLNNDPAIFVNICMAQYYGLSSIRTEK